MKDINEVEIKAGDFIKKTGMVRYADGEKFKISKKTWLVEEKDGELVLPSKAEGIGFLVVGNQTDGIKPEYLPVSEDVLEINLGSVGENYRALKDVDSQNWKKGDIVKIHGKVSKETLENGVLEKCSDEIPHKHVLIVVDPIKLGLVANQTL